VSYLIPVRYIIIIVIRGIILKGVGADVLGTELWAMSVIGAVTVTRRLPASRSVWTDSLAMGDVE